MKKLLFATLLAIWFWFPHMASAQTRCAVGVQTGSAQCLPDDEGGSDGGGGRWYSSYGAIWRDPVTKIWEATRNYPSAAEAQMSARDSCVANGGKRCQSLGYYENECIAMAESEGSNGAVDVRTHRSSTVAKRSARRECEKNGEPCKVVYSACSLPYRG